MTSNSTIIEVPTTLSILIVNWNSKEYLRRCLLSVYKFGSNLATEIIVVDGGSFDGCDKMLHDEFPKVIFIQSLENIGFGRSNNLGAKEARGNLLLLLNPDTEIQSGSLEVLITAYRSLPDVGLIGPRLLNSDGTLQTSSVQAAPTPLNQVLCSEFLMRKFPKSRLWKTYLAYNSATPTEVEAVSGACMLVPTDLYRKVGGFTPSFFMYAEDMDLCFKIRQNNLKIYHIPNSEIVHHGEGSSSKQLSKFSSVMIQQALSHYMVLNQGPMAATFYRLLMLSNALFRIGILSIFNKYKTDTKNSALLKWKSILNWAIGRESWVNRYFT